MEDFELLTILRKLLDHLFNILMLSTAPGTEDTKSNKIKLLSLRSPQSCEEKAMSANTSKALREMCTQSGVGVTFSSSSWVVARG